MPSQLSHILASESAFRSSFPDLARETLADFGPEFRLGSQGPDVFYHNQRTMPSALTYGVLLHKRDYGKFTATLARIAVEGGMRFPSSLGAYILGFATHAIYDRVAHPFIIYHSGWVESGKPATKAYQGCHAFYERVLDMELWKLRTGQEIAAFDQETAMDVGKERLRPIRRHLAKALKAAFPSRTENDLFIQARIKNAFKDAAHIYATTNPMYTTYGNAEQDYLHYLDESWGLKTVSIAYPEDLAPHVDWANREGTTWRHPAFPDEESNEGYFGITERAERDISAMMRALVPALAGSSDDFAGAERAIGNACLNLCDHDGTPTRPCSMRPLPLPEEMHLELERRRVWARKLLAERGDPRG